MPRRFLALYFEDIHTSFEDLVRGRDAADHYLAGAMQQGDRVGVFTSSGQKQLDFTADLGQVHRALFALQPRPMARRTGACVDMPAYEAFLIFHQHDRDAIEVATNEAYNTCYAGLPNGMQLADRDAQSEATQRFELMETESRVALRGIEQLFRYLSSLPGQRRRRKISRKRYIPKRRPTNFPWTFTSILHEDGNRRTHCRSDQHRSGRIAFSQRSGSQRR